MRRNHKYLKTLFQKIRSIIFPNTIVNLDSRACIYFDNLESVVIPKGTESIGADAFLGCSNFQLEPEPLQL